MEDSRKQFEEWYMTTFLVDKYWVEDMRREPETYTLGEGILIYWECWKASSAAIEIELPKNKWHPCDCIDVVVAYDKDDVTDAIHAAGLRVKEK